MVEPQAARFVAALRALPEVVAADFAGSLRRCRSTVRDIDLVVASTQPAAVMDVFATLPELARVEAQGDTKLAAATYTGLGVDLRVVPPESYGDLLQHFTGSADHNVALRGYAQRRGYKISEYCVEHLESGRLIRCATEAEVYELVGLRYIPPELREDQGEIQAAEAGSLPHLVDLRDLRGDLHVHSDWTDGRATLEQMALAAREKGLDYLCFCDHSQSLAMTGGLGPERLLAQQEEIRALDERLDGISLLSGIEVDILADGRLDLPDDVLARLDFVTASIHSGFNQPPAQIMERIVGAMRNPHVRSIAHPSGRLIGRREPYETRRRRPGPGSGRDGDLPGDQRVRRPARSGRPRCAAGGGAGRADGHLQRRPRSRRFRQSEMGDRGSPAGLAHGGGCCQHGRLGDDSALAAPRRRPLRRSRGRDALVHADDGLQQPGHPLV